MGSRLEKGSDATRKRIKAHVFEGEDGDEYEGSKFGGFPEYFRRKKIKLQNLDAELRAQSSDKPQIFKGVVVHVNGYTQPSLNDLHRLIVSHGGGFMQYLDGKTQVTHIVASSLTPKKAVDFRRYRIVKPAWIVDSIAAGALLPWNDYRVVDEGPGQKLITFEGGKVGTQTNEKSRGYRDQTERSWYTSQLNLSQHPDLAQPPTEANQQASKLDTIRPLEDEQELPEKDRDSDDLAHASALPPDPKRLNESVAAADVQHTRGSNVAGSAHSIAEVTVNLGRNDAATSPKGPMTAEEHNSILLSDPHIRKSSVLNPDFLEQYYRESRLHHLSTWKAELKSQLQAITAEKSLSQKARPKRPPGARRYVLHVDFDSFFVAVSLKKHPQYVTKPTVVAHGAGANSEIASCNYPAREFGIKNGMWMKRAHELCSDLKVLPYDFAGYEAASKLFYEAVIGTGGVVQSVSIDEALVDVTALCLPAESTEGAGVGEASICREQEKADELAQRLRDRVKADTGCAVSVGIGGNILLAKVALRKAKPAGQYQIKPGQALDILAGLHVQDLPGVAYSIGGKLEEIGVKVVKDLRELSRERLTTVLGPKTGEKLYNYARGIDQAEVGDSELRKSVSAEVNWGVRFETKEQVDEFLDSLCGELSRRLLKEGVRGKQFTMKIMRRAADAPLNAPKHLGHGKCDVFNKSAALGIASNDKQVLAKEALSIMRGFGFSPGELRGLGVQMTKLEPMRAKGPAEGSQPRLDFKAVGAGLRGPAVTCDADTMHGAGSVQEPGNRPVGSAKTYFQRSEALVSGARDDSADVDEPKTPQKTKTTLAQQASSLFGNPNSPLRKPLNTAGTQFLLPSQVDPSVLSELPADIRGRLAKPTRHQDTKAAAATDTSGLVPRRSQIDPDILEALPADVRAEILAEYGQEMRGRTAGEQSVLPQSPRKIRTVATNSGMRKGGLGITRARRRGPGGHASRSNTTNTLTQANFVAPRARAAADGHDEASSNISADFLAALPEDLRREVVDNHRRAQLQRRGGLEVAQRRGGSGSGARTTTRAGSPVAVRGVVETVAAGDGGASGEHQGEAAIDGDMHSDTPGDGAELVAGARVVHVAAKAPRATFSVRRLSKASEVRAAISEWVDEFADEGPYGEDVGALCRYLGCVMRDEGDMDKAGGLVQWFDWVLSRRHGDRTPTQAPASGAWNKWKAALEGARQAVADAAHARRLGNVAGCERTADDTAEAADVASLAEGRSA